MLFQPLNHLRPVSCTAVRSGAAPTGSICWIAVFARTDYDTASTCLLSPCFHALHQPPVMRWMKTSWELGAELLEHLRGSDIGGAFKAPTNQWPDHIQRVERA